MIKSAKVVRRGNSNPNLASGKHTPKALVRLESVPLLPQDALKITLLPSLGAQWG